MKITNLNKKITEKGFKERVFVQFFKPRAKGHFVFLFPEIAEDVISNLYKNGYAVFHDSFYVGDKFVKSQKLIPDTMFYCQECSYYKTILIYRNSKEGFPCRKKILNKCPKL